MKAIFIGGADRLLVQKTYKLFQSQDFTKGLVRHLIKSLTFTLPATHFVKKQAEKAFASKVRLRQNTSRENTIKEEIKPPSPLKDRFSKSSKTSGKDSEKKKKKNPSALLHFKSSSYSKRGSSRLSDHYEVEKDDEGPRGVNVFKPIKTHLTVALYSEKYRLQM